ncbi:MAG: right-handed parallel beta-helix repeat-containing protein, partial [Acidimicrobiia bacterium]|nr:right-handed parallel beta-helix repeat-containing protein [Acidimicrobiia bacterium]
YCTINAAAGKVVPGVTVQVAAGTYTEKVTVGGNGTAVAPITLSPAPGAVVTVTGGANGFVVTNKSWVSIRGFAIDATKNPGITISGGSNITLDGNHVTHSGNPVNGDTAVGIKLSGVTDSLVVNNITDHNSDAGILVTTDANNNVIRHNESFANARGYVRAAAGIDIRNTTGNVVTGNTTHDNEDSGINLWTGSAQGSNLATNNLTYSNGDHGIDVHNAIDARVIANTVYSNYDSGIEMTTSTGSVLANNISIDNGIGSLRTSGNIRADKASYLTATVNDDLVFLRVPGVMVDWGGVKYSSLASFRAATGQESRGIEADPRFTNPTVADFHLLVGSPAIDAANTAAPWQPLVDFDGHIRYDDATPDSGVGPITFADRGAFEYHP